MQPPAQEHVLQPTQADSEAFSSRFAVAFAAQPSSQLGHHPVGLSQL